MAERALRRANGVLSAVFMAISVLLLVVIVAVVFANVVARDFLSTSIPWSGEVSVFCLLWMTFLGAAVGYHRKMFPAFTAILERLPGRLATFVRLLVLAVNVLAAGMLVVIGWRFASASMAQQSPVLGVSLGLVYLAIPIAGAAMVLMSIELAIDVLRDEGDDSRGLSAGDGAVEVAV